MMAQVHLTQVSTDNSGNMLASDFSVLRSQSSSTANSSARASPDSQQQEIVCAPARRNRHISTSKAEDHLMLTAKGRRVYTKGRPPWFDKKGILINKPFLVGICGGSASGKTTVAENIVEELDIDWVSMLSMDSFYKELTTDDKAAAEKNEYNFDSPNAFDFDLLFVTLERLIKGKACEIPVYDFTTHSRLKQTKTVYGADVIIFEGILAFHNERIRDLMDFKIFVDTDSDERLSRRLERDTIDRGRDVYGVLEQYTRYVKPAYDTFIETSKKYADIIITRGGENFVAINLIVQRIIRCLTERGYDNNTEHRLQLLEQIQHDVIPDSLNLIEMTKQILVMHTIIRNNETTRDELIFYSKRLIRIIIEDAMSKLPFIAQTVTAIDGKTYEGRRRAVAENQICGISIMRAGEIFEEPLREIAKDCRIMKILIQTNEFTNEPALYYATLPANIRDCYVFLCDATIATGLASMMAIRVLLDHDVKEENIYLLSILMAQPGVLSIAYAFPKVKIITTAVDPDVNEKFWIIPGIGNFGDRYYGTEKLDFLEQADDCESLEDGDEEVRRYTEQMHINFKK